MLGKKRRTDRVLNIHHHSEERAFFPFQAVAGDPAEGEQLARHVWEVVEEVRSSADRS